MLVKVLISVLLGVLVCSLMEWLTTAPHGLDVLLGTIVGLLYYFGYPELRR
jgi:fructose-specific phosphotransferase system IIC component